MVVLEEIISHKGTPMAQIFILLQLWQHSKHNGPQMSLFWGYDTNIRVILGQCYIKVLESNYLYTFKYIYTCI